METQLTKAIKTATHYFSPKLNAVMRTIRWADEVWTPTGIVDSIRFEDYYASNELICRIIDHERLQRDPCIDSTKALGKCFRDGSDRVEEIKCKSCVYKARSWTVGMMITCYEVKITYSDFKSKNGHNFHGNENYYVAPVDLAKRIAKEVADDIGVIAYHESGNMRIVKRCLWREVDDASKIKLLYNAFKKWCDGAIFPSLAAADAGKGDNHANQKLHVQRG